MKKLLLCSGAIILQFSIAYCQNKQADFTFLKGSYLTQKQPGMTPELLAQLSTEERNPASGLPFWLNLGVGSGIPGISGGFDVNLGISSRLISQMSFIHSETFELFEDTPEKSITSIGFLIGRRLKGKNTMIAFFCGGDVVFGFRRGKCISSSGDWFAQSNYVKNKFVSGGIGCNVQLFWKPFDFFGLGIEIFGGLNPDIPFVGGLFSLQFSNRN